MDHRLPSTVGNTSPSRELSQALGWDQELFDMDTSPTKSPSKSPFNNNGSSRASALPWEDRIKMEPDDDDVLARFNPMESEQSDGLTPQPFGLTDVAPFTINPIPTAVDPTVLWNNGLVHVGSVPIDTSMPMNVDSSRKRKSIGPSQGSLPISIKSTRSITRSSTTPVLGTSVGSTGRSATGKQQLNLRYGTSAPHAELLSTSVASSRELSGSSEDEYEQTGSYKSQPDKRRKRRESHNAVERRRRDTINDKITELYEMLPAALIAGEGSGPGQAAGSRPNKGVILTRSVEFCRWLIACNTVMEQRLQQVENELRIVRTQNGMDPNGGTLATPAIFPDLVPEPMPGTATTRKRAGSVASTKSASRPAIVTRSGLQVSRPGSGVEGNMYGSSPSNLANQLAASSLQASQTKEAPTDMELLSTLIAKATTQSDRLPLIEGLSAQDLAAISPQGFLEGGSKEAEALLQQIMRFTGK